MRKIIVFVVALVTAIATVLQSQLGITIGVVAAMASLFALIAYIFGEARNDIARVKQAIVQQGKFTDPAFWGALVGGILPVVNATFKLGLSEDIIAGIVAVIIAILGFLFGRRQRAIG